MTKNFLLILAVILGMIINDKAFAQAISPNLFGQNAYLTDTIGSVVAGGKMHNTWQKVKSSKVKVIRFGGITADREKPTNYQYLRVIDSARANGIEPIIQVSYDGGTYTSSQAATLVNYINNIHDRNVQYWIIANEPNTEYSYNASQIATYFKSFASAMKAQDNTIKIIGPELAGYDYTIMGALLGGANDITGTDANGRYYLDIVSFHTYPFGDMDATEPWRSEIIGKLRTNTYGHFKYDLGDLNSKVNTVNSGRSGSPLKIAVTEANIGYRNDTSDDGVTGVWSTNSFIAGQFWAMMMEIAMEEEVEFLNFWSVIEGSPYYDSNSTNIGYLENVSPYNPKPTYHHFTMVADNFKGNFCAGNDNLTNIKCFGSKDASTIVVMVMNLDSVNNYNFRVRLDNNTVSGTEPLKINIDASVAVEYTDDIDNESSIILVFNTSGTLIKKGEYKVGDAVLGNGPTWTYPNPCPAAAGSITGTATVCQGQTSVAYSVGAIANATGYTWTLPTGATIVSGSNTNSITVNYSTSASSGNVTVRGTNSCGNGTISPSYAVTVNTKPTVTASSNTPVCQGDAINLTANTVSGATYSWTGPNSFTSSSEDPTINGAGTHMAGTYSLTITSAQGCSNSGTTYVDVPQFAVITPAGSTTFCSGGSVVLNATTGTGYAYQWKLNGSNISGATNATYTATASGQYQLKVTKDAGTCTAWSSLVDVTVTSTHVATITAGGPTTVCSPQTVTLYANTCSGHTYQWRKKDINDVYQDISGATSSSYAVTQTGRYQVRVTKNSNHVWSSGIDVTVNTCRTGEDLAMAPAEETAFSSQEIKVFPNPTGGPVNVEISLPGITDGNVELQVMNSIGQLVYSSQVAVDEKATHSFELDNMLPNGLYLLQVRSGNTVIQKKIILAK